MSEQDETRGRELLERLVSPGQFPNMSASEGHELYAYVKQIAAERDTLCTHNLDMSKRLGKPRCLDCNSARMSHCSDPEHCGGTWKYELEDKLEKAEQRLAQVKGALRELPMELRCPLCKFWTTGNIGDKCPLCKEPMVAVNKEIREALEEGKA